MSKRKTDIKELKKRLFDWPPIQCYTGSTGVRSLSQYAVRMEKTARTTWG